MKYRARSLLTEVTERTVAIVAIQFDVRPEQLQLVPFENVGEAVRRRLAAFELLLCLQIDQPVPEPDTPRMETIRGDDKLQVHRFLRIGKMLSLPELAVARSFSQEDIGAKNRRREKRCRPIAPRAVSV